MNRVLAIAVIVALFNYIVFMVLCGTFGYFAIDCFYDREYFISAICAALFIRILVKNIWMSINYERNK